MIPHTWQLTPKEARALQQLLAPQVQSDLPLAPLATIQQVAGVDVSTDNITSRAAIVVLSFPQLQVLEVARAELPTTFPYIPGLLSFREGEVILAAQAQLTLRPDVYLFDGMGVLHPRRLGIASHIGLWWDTPTIGCGKTHLLGHYQDPDPSAGSHAPIEVDGQTLGAVLRTRANVKPMYISVGHRATLESALPLVMACVTRYRLPEPIRAAHHYAGNLVYKATPPNP
jgi:deoxyribonuclease V